MKKYRFTLIELLVVVGIIALLAGLLTPAIIGAQQQGRITQAKSDMAAIIMALKGLDNTYNKMVLKDGSNYKFGNKTLTEVQYDSKVKNVMVGDGSSDSDKDRYYAFIAELSDPANGKSGFTNNLSVNKRKMRFLDPKPEYNPAEDYDKVDSSKNIDNPANLWLDPWGNPYVVLINVDYSDEIADPTSSDEAKLAAKAVAFSRGPDGECEIDFNNSGKNTKADDSVNNDNVCSWKDSWK